MDLNVTVYEGGQQQPQPTPGTFHVRAFYGETDAGHVSGPFGSRESAEAAVQALLARPGVVRAIIEEGT